MKKLKIREVMNTAQALYAERNCRSMRLDMKHMTPELLASIVSEQGTCTVDALVIPPSIVCEQVKCVAEALVIHINQSMEKSRVPRTSKRK